MPLNKDFSSGLTLKISVAAELSFEEEFLIISADKTLGNYIGKQELSVTLASGILACDVQESFSQKAFSLKVSQNKQTKLPQFVSLID